MLSTRILWLLVFLIPTVLFFSFVLPGNTCAVNLLESFLLLSTHSLVVGGGIKEGERRKTLCVTVKINTINYLNGPHSVESAKLKFHKLEQNTKENP